MVAGQSASSFCLAYLLAVAVTSDVIMARRGYHTMSCATTALLLLTSRGPHAGKQQTERVLIFTANECRISACVAHVCFQQYPLNTLFSEHSYTWIYLTVSCTATFRAPPFSNIVRFHARRDFEAKRHHNLQHKGCHRFSEHVAMKNN